MSFVNLGKSFTCSVLQFTHLSNCQLVCEGLPMVADGAIASQTSYRKYFEKLKWVYRYILGTLKKMCAYISKLNFLNSKVIKKTPKFLSLFG